MPTSVSRSLGNDLPTTAGWKHASFELKRREADRYHLTMKGYLTPGWTGRLAAGLVRSRLGIVRGEAEKVRASAWHAAFEISRHPLSPDPFGIDFIACAGEEHAAAPAGILTRTISWWSRRAVSMAASTWRLPAWTGSVFSMTSWQASA